MRIKRNNTGLGWAIRRPPAALTLCIVFALGCHKPNSDDVRRLAELEQRYSDRMEFALDGELYLRARIKPGATVTDLDLQHVYRRFYTDEKGVRRATTYVYLNVYDSDDKFVKQIAFDSRTGRLVEGRTEHY